MSLPAPFSWIGEQILLELPPARVIFTTRRGGHSTGPYHSLNLGAMTDDDPAVVAQNRAAVQADLRAPPVSFVHQVHGVDVRVVTDESPRSAQPPRVDAQVTNRRDLALATLTADCLAIAVVGTSAVGMVHAGWKGLGGGIVGAAVRELRQLEPGGHELIAAIGPGAGGCCYEVGDEVRDAFAAYPEAQQGRNIDLRAVATRQLREAGVDTVHDVGICTICSDPELLYSHRRDHGVTGRQAGLVWLN